MFQTLTKEAFDLVSPQHLVNPNIMKLVWKKNLLLRIFLQNSAFASRFCITFVEGKKLCETFRKKNLGKCYQSKPVERFAGIYRRVKQTFRTSPKQRQLDMFLKASGY